MMSDSALPPNSVSHSQGKAGAASADLCGFSVQAQRRSDDIRSRPKLSLYELMNSGQLRSVLVAGRRLIPAEALRELMQGGA
jgi:hypothetical protein